MIVVCSLRTLELLRTMIWEDGWADTNGADDVSKSLKQII